LNSKTEETFQRFESAGLIKSSDRPIQSLSPEQKAMLNRKGNEFFNQGDIEGARRIFVTTGYSDGLSRVGDAYLGKGLDIQALKMYWLAHNRRKSDPIVQKLALVLESIIKE